MRKRVKNTTAYKGYTYFTGGCGKLSNNAKRNKKLNGGRTAAPLFYLTVGSY
ncbi:hypothetical protein [Lonepinella sp. BR2271]|uniref:hypothetical protein n=1 Tax=Lonepinella sp. BR2271 TaxID=3434550 RepID=UPI003F6DF776